MHVGLTSGKTQLLHHSYLGSFTYFLAEFDAKALFLSLQVSDLKICHPCAATLVRAFTRKCNMESMQMLTDPRETPPQAPPHVCYML